MKGWPGALWATEMLLMEVQGIIRERASYQKLGKKKQCTSRAKVGDDREPRAATPWNMHYCHEQRQAATVVIRPDIVVATAWGWIIRYTTQNTIYDSYPANYRLDSYLLNLYLSSLLRIDSLLREDRRPGLPFCLIFFFFFFFVLLCSDY